MEESQEIRVSMAGQGHVSGLLLRPRKARWLLVLAHGAGAGMRHSFLESLANELARVDIATLRYQFPYLEQRRRAPDSPAVLIATVAAALRAAVEAAPGMPLLAGGKSLGGRMTSHAAAQGLLDGVRGLVFYGFPLHPPNAPGSKRADHLPRVPMPMLFLQGTRDPLADLTLLGPICARLGEHATLRIIDSADHSFHVLKRSGTNDNEVLRHLAETTLSWAQTLKPIDASNPH